MNEQSQGKWILSHGIHKGTLASRDSGEPQSFDTHQEAIDALHEHRKFYRRIGYVIWYATLTDPEGHQETLEQNINYY